MYIEYIIFMCGIYVSIFACVFLFYTTFYTYIHTNNIYLDTNRFFKYKYSNILIIYFIILCAYVWFQMIQLYIIFKIL